MTNRIKEKGVVYTPDYIVRIILDQSGYKGRQILKKHVIDNSCGDGAFLIEIVKRYVETFLEINGSNLFLLMELKNDLETYIHGIELDGYEVLKCINNLNNITKSYGLENIHWDINQGDTLKTDKYNKKMDFVLGNPPYVRVHNLKENFDYVKKGKFTQTGMTDLFIIFYEIGLEMLNDTGILGYITPSSIFNSLAGFDFRRYVIKKKLLTTVIDLKHFQAFENFTTYTAILTLDRKNNRDIVEYYDFNEEKNNKQFVDILKYEDFCINKNWYFGEKNRLDDLKKILTVDIKRKTFEIKNGFATLADKIFIKKEFDFESKYIYPIIKSSTKQWYKVFFPYDQKYNIIEFDLFEKKLQTYLIEYKRELENRSLEKNAKWYAFGRTQGIKDFWKYKVSINNLIKQKEDIKLVLINPGEGIYSGLYIVGDFDFDFIKKTLISDGFVNYIVMLGKYKSGGYYTYSSSDLKKYLIYKLQKGE